MGTDITSYAEKCVNGKWVNLDFSPFDWRSYGMYGFLADVRNYSAVEPISQPRGWPEDVSIDADEHDWNYGHSWLSVEEIASFDYEQMTEDRRYMGQTGERTWSGALTAEEGEGKPMTYREFLGEAFFDEIVKLQEIGAERILFCFDC